MKTKDKLLYISGIIAMCWISGCRLATPDFKPPMPKAATQRALSAAPAPVGLAIAWDASTSGGIANYSLLKGISPGVYTNSVAIGNVTNYVVTGLVPGVTYYFAVTAASSNGLESLPSNEINFTIPVVVPPNPPTRLRIVLWAGPLVGQGHWTAISTNLISATNAQASYKQTISLEP